MHIPCLTIKHHCSPSHLTKDNDNDDKVEVLPSSTPTKPIHWKDAQKTTYDALGLEALSKFEKTYPHYGQHFFSKCCPLTDEECKILATCANFSTSKGSLPPHFYQFLWNPEYAVPGVLSSPGLSTVGLPNCPLSPYHLDAFFCSHVPSWLALQRIWKTPSSPQCTLGLAIQQMLCIYGKLNLAHIYNLYTASGCEAYKQQPMCSPCHYTNI